MQPKLGAAYSRFCRPISNARSHPDVLPFASRWRFAHRMSRAHFDLILRALRSTTNACHSLHLTRFHRIMLYHRGHVRSHVHARLHRCPEAHSSVWDVRAFSCFGNVIFPRFLHLSATGGLSLEPLLAPCFIFHVLLDSQFTYRISHSRGASADLRTMSISFGARDGLRPIDVRRHSTRASTSICAYAPRLLAISRRVRGACLRGWPGTRSCHCGARYPRNASKHDIHGGSGPLHAVF